MATVVPIPGAGFARKGQTGWFSQSELADQGIQFMGEDNQNGKGDRDYDLDLDGIIFSRPISAAI